MAAIVAEGLTIAGGLTRSEQAERVDEALIRVGLDPALGTRRPGQISGGQRQRVALARAIAVRPKVLLCDEPVSALDASSRNRVLLLLDRLRRELGVAIVMISHDLTSLAGVVDRVAVLFGGRIGRAGPGRGGVRRPRPPVHRAAGRLRPEHRRPSARPSPPRACARPVTGSRGRTAAGAATPRCARSPPPTAPSNRRARNGRTAGRWPAITPKPGPTWSGRREEH